MTAIAMDHYHHLSRIPSSRISSYYALVRFVLGLLNGASMGKWVGVAGEWKGPLHGDISPKIEHCERETDLKSMMNLVFAVTYVITRN